MGASPSCSTFASGWAGGKRGRSPSKSPAKGARGASDSKSQSPTVMSPVRGRRSTVDHGIVLEEVNERIDSFELHLAHSGSRKHHLPAANG